jgi:hypothetical protein
MAKLNNDELKILKRLVSAENIYGLPIAEGASVLVYYDKDGLVIIAGTQVFGLGYDVIIDICTKTDVEISRQYVSSTGKAIGGAILFGPIGAIIGGRVKEKKTTVAIKYTIITYIKNGELEYLCFKPLTTGTTYQGNFLTDELNKAVRAKLKPNTGTIQSLSEDTKPNENNVVSAYRVKAETIEMINATLAKFKRLVEESEKSTRNTIAIILTMIVVFIFAVIILNSAGNSLNTSNSDTSNLGTETSTYSVQ